MMCLCAYLCPWLANTLPGSQLIAYGIAANLFYCGYTGNITCLRAVRYAEPLCEKASAPKD